MKEALAKGLLITSKLFAGLASLVDAKTVQREAQIAVNRFLKIDNLAPFSDEEKPKAQPIEWRYDGYL